MSEPEPEFVIYSPPPARLEPPKLIARHYRSQAAAEKGRDRIAEALEHLHRNRQEFQIGTMQDFYDAGGSE